MEDYEIIEELGSGIQGKTYLAKYLPLAKTCCLKEIECKDSDQAHKIFEEMLRVRTSIESDDPSIALPFCMFIHWDASITSFFFYQAYDYFTSGNLKTLMEKRYQMKEPISEKMIRKWVGEMIHIFQFLKSKNIIHRCLRPSNFFFRSGMSIMLSDICCSFVKEDINTRTRVSTGCMTFSAPEMVVGGEEDSFNTDFWSMGTVVLGLLTSFQINYGDFCAHLIEYNFSSKALDSLFSSLSVVYSPDLISTIKDILNKDKNKRINLDNLNEYLTGILDEIDKETQMILDGVLQPLDLTQSQDYYINYLINNYKSRICFRELLQFLNDNISEEWSLFSLDDSVCSTLLSSILHHINTPDICSLGMRILGTQSVGMKLVSEFFELEKLIGVCNLARKYPLCPEIQHATAKIFYACRNNSDSRMYLLELNSIEILMDIMKNFSTSQEIMVTVMKALWPMLLNIQNAQKVHNLKGCDLIVRIIGDNFANVSFFGVACLAVYGISLYDPNVVRLNEANCIPTLLTGLFIHKRDPTVVTNACNALCSMTDAEEESAYILATTKCDAEDTSGIELLGELCELHMDSQDVVEVILKVFTSLCRHDDIVSEMRCSVVGEAINDLAYAYIDIYEVSNVCSELQKKIKELQPLAPHTMSS